MELSTSFKKIAKQFGASEQQLLMADLIAIGYSENDAFNIAHPENITYTIQQNNNLRQNIVKTQKFRSLVAERKDVIRNRIGDPTSEDIQLIGADEVAKEILRSAYGQPSGSKERADLMAKYQEIIKKNEQSDENKEQFLMFYFPVCCDKCPLMTEYKEKKKDERLERKQE